jgi:hypothetical protein
MAPEGQRNHDLALSLHALGLVPRVEGRAAGLQPRFDKLSTGLPGG